MGDENILKKTVIDLARAEAQDGAHYLWGAAGNRPGKGDGASYRSSYVLLHANIPNLDVTPEAGKFKGIPYVPTLFAGWAHTFDQGRLACAGRCALKEVQDLPLALSITVKEALALKLNALTQAQIEELQKIRTTAADYRWPRPNGSLERAANPSTIWGESCTGKRHFDCIGLVNYCMSTALKKLWQVGIDNFTNPSLARSAGFAEVKLGVAQACDIVTYGSEHIGIVTESRTVVEAMDPANGIVEMPIDKRPWQQCWRIPAITWKMAA